MQSKFVFCDLDGTILDDRLRHYDCYEAIVNMYGGMPIPSDCYWHGKRTKMPKQTLLEKSKFLGTLEQYDQAWLDLIETERFLSREILKEGAAEKLLDISRDSSSLVLVTMRRDRALLIRQLEKLGILSYFDEVWTGSPMTMEKADFARRCESHNNVVIGDTEADREFAQAIGGKFIMVSDGLRDPSVLEADCYVDTFSSIQLTGNP